MSTKKKKKKKGGCICQVPENQASISFAMNGTLD